MKAISIPMAERTKQTSLLYLQTKVTVLQILSDESCNLAWAHGKRSVTKFYLIFKPRPEIEIDLTLKLTFDLTSK